MNDSFSNQFSENIKFKYFCFDRVIIRGYILSLFFPAGIVRFLRTMHMGSGQWTSSTNFLKISEILHKFGMK